MDKKGMSLVTLVMMLVIIISVMYLSVFGLTKMNEMPVVEKTNANMDLLNLQQLANMAYSNIYFENLRQGVRRELTAEEIRSRMLKNGTGEIDLSKYNIVVENGDVFVSVKEEK